MESAPRSLGKASAFAGRRRNQGLDLFVMPSHGSISPGKPGARGYGKARWRLSRPLRQRVGDKRGARRSLKEGNSQMAQRAANPSLQVSRFVTNIFGVPRRKLGHAAFDKSVEEPCSLRRAARGTSAGETRSMFARQTLGTRVLARGPWSRRARRRARGRAHMQCLVQMFDK